MFNIAVLLFYLPHVLTMNLDDGENIVTQRRLNYQTCQLNAVSQLNDRVAQRVFLAQKKRLGRGETDVVVGSRFHVGSS